MFNYIKSIFIGIFRLMQGMYVSMLNMWRKKVTEKYPENRKKKILSERYRGILTMPHNENNEHKCTACGLCMTNCPNGTINLSSKKELDKTTGKEKRALDIFYYDLGSCTYCSICTITCPQDAIVWSPLFEHAVFTRYSLVKQLNKETS